VSATTAPAPEPDTSPAVVPAQPSAAPAASPENAVLAAWGLLPDDAPETGRPVDDSAEPFAPALAAARAIPDAAGGTADRIALGADAPWLPAADRPVGGEGPSSDSAGAFAQDLAVDLLDVLEPMDLGTSLDV
jgi:hypothetical protein